MAPHPQELDIVQEDGEALQSLMQRGKINSLDLQLRESIGMLRNGEEDREMVERLVIFITGNAKVIAIRNCPGENRARPEVSHFPWEQDRQCSSVLIDEKGIDLAQDKSKRW